MFIIIAEWFIYFVYCITVSGHITEYITRNRTGGFTANFTKQVLSMFHILDFVTQQ